MKIVIINEFLGLRSKIQYIIDSFKDTFKIQKNFSLNDIDNNIIEMKIWNNIDFIENNFNKTTNCYLLNEENIVTYIQGIIIGDLNITKNKRKYFTLILMKN